MQRHLVLYIRSMDSVSDMRHGTMTASVLYIRSMDSLSDTRHGTITAPRIASKVNGFIISYSPSYYLILSTDR